MDYKTELEVYKAFARNVNIVVNSKNTKGKTDNDRIEFIREMLIVLDEQRGE